MTKKYQAEIKSLNGEKKLGLIQLAKRPSLLMAIL